jgi:hypothetical protein
MDSVLNKLLVEGEFVIVVVVAVPAVAVVVVEAAASQLNSRLYLDAEGG